MDMHELQAVIADCGLDGWLFCDFHNRDPIAYRILGLDFGRFTSRRWFYFVPARGEPVCLQSRVEPARLDPLPGERRFYLSMAELEEQLGRLVKGLRVAMQYSPGHAIPAVSTVDAGMVELVRAAGAKVVSSADLVQRLDAVIDRAGYESHMEAGRRLHRVKDDAFTLIHDALRDGRCLTEYDVQRFILRRYEEEGLDCKGEEPIVGVNDHPADPHFVPTPENARQIRPGDTILIDIWACLAKPRAIFHDITWCGFAGVTPPAEYVRIFEVVRDARDAAIAFAARRLQAGEPCAGFEVDDACRAVVRAAGYGDAFIHRTGHSIGVEVHGNGVNIDNLETHDERRLVPGICFSVEPGIYLPGRMAARSEVDVFVHEGGRVEVTGPAQRELVLV